MKANRRKTPTGSMAVVTLIALALAGPAQAEKKLSRSTYEKLNTARDLVDQGKHDKALAKLDKLLADVGERKYARAITLQAIGYAHVGQENDRKAIKAFEKALALDVLPDSPRLKLHNMLARLYARTEQYSKAREYLDAWFDQIKEPGADDLALKANILVQLGDNKEGIKAIRKAIAMSDRPREQYYQVLVSLLFGAKRYNEAADTLRTMLSYWPNKERYWRQLGSVYLNLDEKEQAHAVLKLAYRKGMLTEEDQILRLARVALAIGTPAEAGELLVEEIEKGRVSATEDNWELAGHAWARAKEWQRAIQAYGRAARKGSPAKYHMRRARMFTYQNEWENAIQAARKALQEGEPESPGRAHILIGRGYLELDQHDKALAAFEAAKKYKETADQAQQWRQYAEREREYASASTTS